MLSVQVRASETVYFFRPSGQPAEYFPVSQQAFGVFPVPEPVLTCPVKVRKDEGVFSVDLKLSASVFFHKAVLHIPQDILGVGVA